MQKYNELDENDQNRQTILKELLNNEYENLFLNGPIFLIMENLQHSVRTVMQILISLF